MLPLEFELLRPIYRQSAKFVMLNSGSHFGHQTDPNHVMIRLENFIQSSKSPETAELYRDLFAKGTRHPDLYLEDKGYSTKTLNTAFQPGKHELLDYRKHTDLPTSIHLASGGKFERYLVKLMTRLDNEALLKQPALDWSSDEEEPVDFQLNSI